jgi:hypothetical protein
MAHRRRRERESALRTRELEGTERCSQCTTKHGLVWRGVYFSQCLSPVHVHVQPHAFQLRESTQPIIPRSSRVLSGAQRHRLPKGCCDFARGSRMFERLFGRGKP